MIATSEIHVTRVSNLAHQQAGRRKVVVRSISPVDNNRNSIPVKYWRNHQRQLPGLFEWRSRYSSFSSPPHNSSPNTVFASDVRKKCSGFILEAISWYHCSCKLHRCSFTLTHSLPTSFSTPLYYSEAELAALQNRDNIGSWRHCHNTEWLRSESWQEKTETWQYVCRTAAIVGGEHNREFDPDPF